MKKTSSAIAFLCIVFLFSCKKSSGPQSIAGTWSLSNVSGTYTYNQNDTDGETITYTYNSGTLTSSDLVTGYTMATISTTLISSEVWTFNANGTYTISESYTKGTNGAETATMSGTWEYLSNTQTNNGFTLVGPQSNVISGIYSNNRYTIQSISGKTMVLEIVQTDTTNYGFAANYDVFITFTKQ